MQEYPYNSPLILTDSVFLAYGGQTGSSTALQRQAAYLLAEEQMTEHLSTFLVPTVITGTIFLKDGTLFETEFGHIRRVLGVWFETIYSAVPLTLLTTTGSAIIRNAEYGYLDVIAGCYYGSSLLYKSYAAYESGLSTGTVTQPSMLSALTMAAQINLNEVDVSLSNESTADVGVQRFSNQSYSEERTKLLNTVFGNSAMAQRVARLVKKYRSKPGVRLR